MSTTSIVDDLKDLNREVCRRLWSVVTEGETVGCYAPRIIFPTTSAGSRRVSEQEARFTCAAMLDASDYRYSVETPTNDPAMYKRKQDGISTSCAHTDMSLYLPRNSVLRRVANIEFKHKSSAVGKDIEKLVREGSRNPPDLIHGNYFQLFAAADWSTISTLFSKLRTAFAAVDSHLSTSILFCMCVLDKNSVEEQKPWACLKHFYTTDGSDSIAQTAKDEFKPLDRPDTPRLTRKNTAEQLQIALGKSKSELVTP